MKTEIFDWKRFHAYRVFDEYLERFVFHRRSYVTRHSEQLDIEAAFEDIRKRFVSAFDDSDAHFEEKVSLQFKSAPEQTKIVFANVEYLWAMPMQNITWEKKRSYAQRWFKDSGLVVSGGSYFFDYPHIIANPGPWYVRNKYWELVAAMRVLNIVSAQPDLKDIAALKQKIAAICHEAIYKGVPLQEKFAVSNYCGIHAALMHLADPERYESIISDSHRRQICAVFEHVVENPSPDTEKLLKDIRYTLFESHGNSQDKDRKYRWFFYTSDVKPLWIDKKTKKEQKISSANFDVRLEEDAVDLEGNKEEILGYRIRRSAKLVKETKKRDGYTCRACGFNFENQIVHVHHLDPLSEYKRPQETKLVDLLTLCPTCHYLAHYWLRISDSDQYKKVEALLAKLQCK